MKFITLEEVIAFAVNHMYALQQPTREAAKLAYERIIRYEPLPRLVP